ncbi:MAG: sulfate reduction electron transfer complex DsrMKJOP subunit DsrJ [Desulfobacterales bacterium]|nr:MAG: sulfate reduction electron transfer complex DsrMKJOP subunit DsrJ [Desulfobacterales bacterium]UCD91382.1 MAG: sulfate reduction electron transfer complex DsrMKJOP subunit DsrJ [Desulfobacterales bacterium]
MYDKGKVVVGLCIFVILVTFPVWYNLGKAAPAPELVLSDKAKAAKECVEETSYMKAEHMQILDVWRDTVVRDAKRVYVNSKGKEYEMSLSNTCLDCHVEKAQFCDKCHDYASVTPYCWDCHIDPKEMK